MCGLAGILVLSGGKADREVVGRMADAMYHRGPDDEGEFVDGPVGFGFRRLAILDVSPTGHQPMVSADGRYVIVFNGEIYNYIELRRELETLGHRFRSSGDTEVLLAAYAQWGKECLPKLNGMWAFLIYDTVQKTIFGSRDRFGVKPLFYYRSNSVVLFASEIKGILATDYYPANVNWQVASQFLIDHRFATGNETFFRDIFQVSPGTCFEVGRDGHWSQWRYWSLPETALRHDDDPPARFLELFEDAVRLRLRSDVSVGISLSGGMDSTSVICMMARLKGTTPHNPDTRLQAFSYMSTEFDESSYIEETLAQTQATIHRVQLDTHTLIDNLKTCLWFQDEPVHSWSAVVGFAIMGLAARNGVKVILGGQGADETIGGYFSYFPNYWASLVDSEGIRKASQEIRAYAEIHGGQVPQLLAGLLIDMAKSRLAHFKYFRTLARWRRNATQQKHAWFSPQLFAQLPEAEYHADQRLETTQHHAITCDPLPTFLRVEDRNSMAHSVEARLPFMDYRLVLYNLGLPVHWRMNGPWNKHVLREAMRGKIPEAVRARRDKMGWPVPDQRWFAERVRTYLLELLDSQAMRERGIYNLATIRADLERCDATTFPRWRQALDIVQFETWTQKLCSSAVTSFRSLPASKKLQTLWQSVVVMGSDLLARVLIAEPLLI